jgi:hypothetical protein
MFSSINGTPSSSVLLGGSPQSTTPSGSTDSFTQQLTAAIEQYLGQSGNSSNLEIDIQSTGSQNSGSSQFLVTVTNPSSTGQPAAASSPSASSGSPTSGTSLTSVSTPQSNSSETTGTASTQAPLTSSQLIQAETDAYWAAQPPAVQQLRNIGDFNARMSAASELASQGYAIDKGIMVWGYDPLKTMTARQIYGYSWVPSFNQNITSAPPGFALSNETAYDPTNPPAGSIQVSTAFANGLGITDPFALGQNSD